jgi:uroporphyrinogen decarboxylase
LSRKEQVKKAIHMQSPDYVPLLYSYFLSDSLENSDIINVDLEMHFLGDNKDISEWGFKWEFFDRNLVWGQVKSPTIQTWNDIQGYKPPDPYNNARFVRAKEARERWGNDRYYMGNLMLSGFTIMWLLRGLGSLLEDLYVNRDRIEQLADIVFGFEENIITQLGNYGFDAVALADDYGSQQNLLMNPLLWREVFKPRLKKQVELAHNRGLDVFLHSCGYIFDIIQDFVDIGIDMLNPGQPNLNGIKQMGERFGGQICFVCPVNYQTTGISGTKQQIFSEVEEYVRYLGSRDGGLIGIVNTDIKSLGASAENAQAIVDAFQRHGGYRMV